MEIESLTRFKRQNNILNSNEIYQFDQEQHNQMLTTRPWSKDPNYFKKCKISINALIKMLIHACLGKNNEIMGLLQGRYTQDTFIIYDIVQLAAEASETTVALTPQTMADFCQTLDDIEKVGRVQPIVGWYHSHPNFGCWLSGTDVETQIQQQQFYQTSVAVVVDPIRSLLNQKVDIGAFRVYPRDYKPPKKNLEDIFIPAQKVKDFGAHHERYYSLDVSFFSNELDSIIINDLWEKYWGLRLSQSPISDSNYFENGLKELRERALVQQQEQSLQMFGEQSNNQINQSQNKQKLKDSTTYSQEFASALLAEAIKQQLFK
ncbi:hypothetical protein pb186bvf_008120 [Paramecium bursaria]